MTWGLANVSSFQHPKMDKSYAIEIQRNNLLTVCLPELERRLVSQRCRALVFRHVRRMVEEHARALDDQLGHAQDIRQAFLPGMVVVLALQPK